MNIIELAKQAGFERLGHTNDDWVCGPEDIKAFAALVAAQEREACAKLCDALNYEVDAYGAQCAVAIRARGRA